MSHSRNTRRVRAREGRSWQELLTDKSQPCATMMLSTSLWVYRNYVRTIFRVIRGTATFALHVEMGGCFGIVGFGGQHFQLAQPGSESFRFITHRLHPPLRWTQRNVFVIYRNSEISSTPIIQGLRTSGILTVPSLVW